MLSFRLSVCLQEVALRHSCIDSVDFDYKAWPIDHLEQHTQNADTRKPIFAKGLSGGFRIAERSLSAWPNDPYLQLGAQWELFDDGGVQAQEAWKASRGKLSPLAI